MNQEILLERDGDAIHLVYRHFRDPLAANMLGHRLGLHEVPPPGTGAKANGPEEGEEAKGLVEGNGHRTEATNGHHVPGLHCGEYYQLPLATGDSELHALVPMSELGEVGEALQAWQLPVIDGADLLADAPPVSRVAAPAVADEPEKPGRSIGTVVRTTLVVLSLLAVAGAGVFLGWRLFTREGITMGQCMARAMAPPAPGAGAAIQRWALARDVNIPLRGVLFLGESKLVLADGSFVAIEGAGDLRGLLPLAQAEKVEPMIQTAAWPSSPAGEFPSLPIDRIQCGKAIFSRGGILRPLTMLRPAVHRPDRSPERQPESFWLVNDLRYDDSRRLARLAGQRLSVSGRVTIEGHDRVLRLENGTGILLQPLPAGSRVEPFLAELVNDDTPVQVDLEFERTLPWRNAKQPDASRQETRIAGVGRVFSVSAESLVLADAD